jgi:hypothetical protein
MIFRSRTRVASAVLVASLALMGCGDQARYTGLVKSVDGDELCLGPNSSSPNGTCGTIPVAAVAPQVGACVSLTADHRPNGERTWDAAELKPIADSRCSES